MFQYCTVCSPNIKSTQSILSTSQGRHTSDIPVGHPGLKIHEKDIFLLTVTGDDANNQTLNTKDEFGIEIIVKECDGYLGRGRIAFDL